MRQPKNQNLGVWERFNTTLGKRLHENLLQEMLKGKSLQTRFTFSRFLGILIALCVYACAFLLLGSGIFLLVTNRGNIFVVIYSLVLLGFAYLSFPRFYKLTQPIIERKEFPALYQITDMVAQSLGAHKVDGIVVNGDFNAAFARVGWQQKRILYLGMPLLTALDDREKVALLAHELAHDINKDPTRNFFVQSALYALINWHNVLHPRGLTPEGPSQGIFFVVWVSQILANLLLLIPVGFALLGIYCLSQVLWRESQRAEYLADYLSAQTGGPQYAKGALTKYRYVPRFEHIVAKVALNYKNPLAVDVFENFKNEIQADTPKTFEVVDNNSSDDEFRLDSSHPPTQHRIRFLESLPMSSPKVTISNPLSEKIENELALLKPDIQKKLVNLYEARISN